MVWMGMICPSHGLELAQEWMQQPCRNTYIYIHNWTWKRDMLLTIPKGKTDFQCHCFGVPQVIITKLCPDNPKKLARLLLGRGNCQTHTALSPQWSSLQESCHPMAHLVGIPEMLHPRFPRMIGGDPFSLRRNTCQDGHSHGYLSDHCRNDQPSNYWNWWTSCWQKARTCKTAKQMVQYWSIWHNWI